MNISECACNSEAAMCAESVHEASVHLTYWHGCMNTSECVCNSEAALRAESSTEATVSGNASLDLLMHAWRAWTVPRGLRRRFVIFVYVRARSRHARYLDRTEVSMSRGDGQVRRRYRLRSRHELVCKSRVFRFGGWCTRLHEYFNSVRSHLRLRMHDFALTHTKRCRSGWRPGTALQSSHHARVCSESPDVNSEIRGVMLMSGVPSTAFTVSFAPLDSCVTSTADRCTSSRDRFRDS